MVNIIELRTYYTLKILLHRFFIIWLAEYVRSSSLFRLIDSVYVYLTCHWYHKLRSYKCKCDHTPTVDDLARSVCFNL